MRTGAAGIRVARNVAQLREQRGMSVRALSARMDKLGRPLLPSGITKLEQGDRRVDVEDLLALAVAFGVNPSRLLLGPDGEDQPVILTPTVTVPAWAAWQWADGFQPLPTRPADDEDYPFNTPDEVDDFHYHARPAGVRRQEQHPLPRAALNLYTTARRVVAHATKPRNETRTRADQGLATALAAARRHLSRVASELDALADGSPGHGER